MTFFYPGGAYDPYNSWDTRREFVAPVFDGKHKPISVYVDDVRYKPSTYPHHPEQWTALAEVANMNDPFDSLRQ